MVWAGVPLTEFVLDRIDRIDNQAAALRNSAGTGAPMDLFGSVAVALRPGS